MDIQSPAALSDGDLLTRTKRLAAGESRATAALIAHLAEIETRKLYLGEACSSLFTYCVRVLHLSEPAAYNRIQAARLARRFPAVLTSLEQGTVHLAAVRLLAPVLTFENHRALLGSAAHKSKREIEELVAQLHPQPDVPCQVRKLPAARPAMPDSGLFAMPETSQPERVSPAPTAPSATSVIPAGPAAHAPTAPTAPTATSSTPGTPATPAIPATLAAPAPSAPLASPQRGVVVPLSPERYKVQFTMSAATRGKLRRAQELLRHRIPGGEVGSVIGLALDLLVRDLEKRKFAATDRPPRTDRTATARQEGLRRQEGSRLREASPPHVAAHSRHIPAAVRRAVWERDQGCCAFVNAAGERCRERGGLEFDHVRPHADGGGGELWNVRLLCRQHNQFEAANFFGLWQTAPENPLVAERR